MLFAIAGGTAVLTLVAACMWLVRRRGATLERWVTVWSAMALGVQSVRILQLQTSSPDSAVLYGQVTYALVFLMLTTLVGFSCDVSRTPLSRKLAALTLGLPIILAVVSLATPWLVGDVYQRTGWDDVVYWDYSMAPAGMVMAPVAWFNYIIVVRQTLRSDTLGSDERVTFIIGFGLYLALGTVDIMDAMTLFQAPATYPIAFLVVGLTMMAMTATRLRRLDHHLKDGRKLIEQRNRDLDLALGDARAASKARAMFVAHMSHELRTPINGVLGMGALLADSPLTEEQRQYVTAISASGKSLLAVIDDVLDFARIDGDRIELNVAPFEPASLMTEVVQGLADAAHRRGLDLAARLCPRLPLKVVGDGARLRQILTNLVGNAIKFTKRGGVTVAVDVVSGREADDTTLRFSVTDTGIGMDNATVGRIFNAFEQADNATSRKYGGTGLGLAIVKGVVDAMGSGIDVESAVGAGTTFSFECTLPVAEPAPLVTLLPPVAGRRVLLVNTRAQTQAALAPVLGAAGVKWEATSSLEGLEAALQDGGWDAALVACPGGPVLLETICHSGVPIVAAPPLGQKGALRQAQEAGVAHVLPLPLDPRTFIGALSDIEKVCTIGAAHTDAPPPAPIRHAPVADTAPQPDRATGAYILVVEDNPVNQLVAIRSLERLGHTAVLAENGQAALDRLEERTFDLVSMDGQMPVMDGYEVTRQIRARLNLDIPIIAMTANAMRGDREVALAAGMNDYLAKPFVLQDLARVVDRALVAR